jgi:hypothetical protein
MNAAQPPPLLTRLGAPGSGRELLVPRAMLDAWARETRQTGGYLFGRLEVEGETTVHRVTGSVPLGLDCDLQEIRVLPTDRAAATAALRDRPGEACLGWYVLRPSTEVTRDLVDACDRWQPRPPLRQVGILVDPVRRSIGAVLDDGRRIQSFHSIVVLEPEPPLAGVGRVAEVAPASEVAPRQVREAAPFRGVVARLATRLKWWRLRSQVHALSFVAWFAWGPRRSQ